MRSVKVPFIPGGCGKPLNGWVYEVLDTGAYFTGFEFEKVGPERCGKWPGNNSWWVFCRDCCIKKGYIW